LVAGGSSVLGCGSGGGVGSLLQEAARDSSTPIKKANSYVFS